MIFYGMVFCGENWSGHDDVLIDPFDYSISFVSDADLLLIIRLFCFFSSQGFLDQVHARIDHQETLRRQICGTAMEDQLSLQLIPNQI